jgi:hypothetical protein
MKIRLMATILIMLAILTSFFSCEKAPPPGTETINVGMLETYIVSGTNSGSLKIEKNTDPWESDDFVREGAVQEKQITIFGKEYTAIYRNSRNEHLMSYVTDHYETEDNIEIGIRSDTGTVVHLNVMNRTFFNTEPRLPERE